MGVNVIYTEAFESIPSWFAGKGTVTASGHTGNAVQLLGSEAFVTYTIASGDRGADTTVEFWFNMSIVGGSRRDICQLQSPVGTAVASVSVGLTQIQATSGSYTGTVINVGPAISVGIWYKLTLRAVVHDSAGEIHASLDGTEFATWVPPPARDTKPGSSTVIEALVLTGNSVATATNGFDDLTITTAGAARAYNVYTEAVVLPDYLARAYNVYVEIVVGTGPPPGKALGTGQADGVSTVTGLLGKRLSFTGNATGVSGVIATLTLVGAVPVIKPPTDLFNPPIYVVMPDDYRPVPETSQRLFAHYSNRPVGRNIYRLVDGTFTETQPDEDVPGSVIRTIYFGGHITPLTDEEVAALTAAGYGAYITHIAGGT